MKRKGESYIGGNTVITLHPRTVEAGLVEQAAEYKRQAQNDQQKFDELYAKQVADADLIEYRTHTPQRHARQTAEVFYRDQLTRIERALHLKPHPRIVVELLSQELVLLEKLLGVVHNNNSTKRKITRRMQSAQNKLQRLCDGGT